ncbi:hypothetical protein KUL72_14175 [Bradyrhizobium arachidis]|uniref:hypothetical protein n=1 Tax=Bradyrhizobium arachidis TaxID=858423 RepID=UPI002162C002|nr:hypothetical protein [Bradyrhizobium arachidis]UVO39412.1 hypothetical protein KUL72_14175 [Bradyrhizobium arachidis]
MIGLIGAIAALFIRELAAPYVVLCIAFAIYQKNTRELVGLALGLAGYFAYLLLHWIRVAHQLGANERTYSEGWIQFGGVRFILQTAHFNGIFLLLPLWLTALILPAPLTGLFAWLSGLRAALTVTTYLCFFAVAGKPFNYYWGALYAPVLILGLPWSIPAVYDAFALRQRT